MGELYQLIEQHLKFLKSSIHLTDLMVKRAQFGDIQELDRLSQNRGRLICLLTELKAKIEHRIKELDQNALKQSPHREKIKEWANKLSKWTKNTQEKDRTIQSFLLKMRNETGTEISNIFKTKQQFKGYNLNSTKR